MFKICVKFEQNRTILCRVNDDLAHYRREIFEGVAFPRKDLRGAWTELHQAWKNRCLSSVLTEQVTDFRYLAAFSNAGASKLSDVKNDAKFHTF